MSSRRLHDSLSHQAERRPDACALVFGNKRMSYAELDDESNRLARALQAVGCVPEDRVALLLPKSIEAIVAIFGVLKADCIYVPLDTASPPARLARILEACETRCVLAVQSTAPLLREAIANLPHPPRIGWMDDAPPELSGFSRGDLSSFSASAVASRNRSDTAAHILFTSGSTGIPKGVVITHSNVIHFVDWAVRYFGISESDRISGHPPLHFDLSTFDIHGTIAAGAELHLIPAELSILPHRLAAYIRTAALTQWFSVPSVLNHLANADVILPNDFPALRRLLWCGEKFPIPALIYWMSRLPHVTFVNLYGPTEATIASSFYRVPECPPEGTADIPIGEPCAGEELLMLDENLQPVAPGEIGDLYIAGVGLSPGYWRDEEKTQAVFLPRPNGSDPLERIYKTGDLARLEPDGLHLLGRSDSQIKSRGYRIELGEIEAALHAITGVRDAAVVGVETGGFEGMAICCAYVPASKTELSPARLKRDLSQRLPGYMIPAYWMVLDAMPLNANGKTHRPCLKGWFRSLAGVDENIAAAS